MRQLLIACFGVAALLLFTGIVNCSTNMPAKELTKPVTPSTSPTMPAPPLPAGSRYYLAYGSNMDPARMSARCPESALVSTARLDGYRFIINTNGVATILPRANSVVYGVLWAISEADEQALDEYEGVGSGVYYKKTLQVKTDQGTSILALVYIASNGNPSSLRYSLYTQMIISAARHFSLPQGYIEELSTWLSTRE